jgi:hypothetical protein
VSGKELELMTAFPLQFITLVRLHEGNELIVSGGTARLRDLNMYGINAARCKFHATGERASRSQSISRENLS